VSERCACVCVSERCICVMYVCVGMCVYACIYECVCVRETHTKPHSPRGREWVRKCAPSLTANTHRFGRETNHIMVQIYTYTSTTHTHTHTRALNHPSIYAPPQWSSMHIRTHTPHSLTHFHHTHTHTQTHTHTPLTHTHTRTPPTHSLPPHIHTHTLNHPSIYTPPQSNSIA